MLIGIIGVFGAFAMSATGGRPNRTGIDDEIGDDRELLSTDNGDLWDYPVCVEPVDNSHA